MSPQVGVGPIATGGQYNNLVAMFAAAAADDSKKAAGLLCVSVSIRLDYIFAVLWPRWVKHGMRSKEVFMYVLLAGNRLIPECMGLMQELGTQGIAANFLVKNKPKLKLQFAAGKWDEVPYAIILSRDKLKAGLVMVKEQHWKFVTFCS